MRGLLSMLGVVVLLSLPRTSLAVPVCGDGMPEPPELCDDGNLVDGDGCDSNCTPTGCGNGIVTTGEQCDDGNLVDGDCCSATCQLEEPPLDCSDAVASVDQLWPPNHKMVAVTVNGVVDTDGHPVTISVTGITQDEPLDATGDGSTCPDATGVGTPGASLRSERSGNGDGRVYHVAFQAASRCNVTCTGEVTVCVRHDNRPGGTCVDGGALYDSTGGAPPCSGDSCGPEDCVPDPSEIGECPDGVPAAVQARLDRARDLLGRVAKHGHGTKLARQAAKQLAKAAKRVTRSAKRGALSDDCATALTGALQGADTCAMCRGE